MTTPYNGYPNYETWATALWLDNDHALDDEVRSVLSAERERGPDPERPHQTEAHRLADCLEQWVKGLAPELGPTLWADLLTAALGAVDWDFLGRGYLAELEEEQTRQAAQLRSWGVPTR